MGEGVGDVGEAEVEEEVVRVGGAMEEVSVDAEVDGVEEWLDLEVEVVGDEVVGVELLSTASGVVMMNGTSCCTVTAAW